ncbi:unnamed protein product [Linum tenue]|uniref:Uncharacterized protein n=1 Tax=Linum tenue TaxID=586396 RepID=A0AAV0M5S3_9ROSI|nr:unnamed protein product [Linum tenue]
MIQSGSSSAPATASTQMGSVQTGLLKLDTGKPRARTVLSSPGSPAAAQFQSA